MTGEPDPAAHTFDGLPADLFLIPWNASPTYREACEAVGLSPTKASRVACRLRRAGYKVRRFSCWGTPVKSQPQLQ